MAGSQNILYPHYSILLLNVLFTKYNKQTWDSLPVLSFLLPSRRLVRSYRPYLEEMDPYEAMTGRTAPSSDGLLGVSSTVRQMPEDLCAAPRSILFSHLSLATDVTGKWPLARNPDRRWWHCHIRLKLLWLQPMVAPCNKKNTCVHRRGRVIASHVEARV